MDLMPPTTTLHGKLMTKLRNLAFWQNGAQTTYGCF